jgi:vacuolar-type H+-ATPase subunit H
MLLVLLLLVVGSSLLLGAYFQACEQKANAEARAAEERRAKQTAEAAEAQRKLNEEREWKARHAEFERASRERAEAEAQAIVANAMGLVPHLQNGIDRAKGFAAVDEMLREVLLTRLVRGKYLTVKYVASPTGRMALEWVVTHARLDEARVALFCDDTKIMSDVGTSNRWGGQVHRGVAVRLRLRCTGPRAI